MQVLTREQFLRMPTGTVYAKGARWHFDSIHLKGATVGNDWIYVDPCVVESDSFGQMIDRLEEMLSAGASYPMNGDTERDGLYEGDALFLVFETGDLLRLRAMIDSAVSVTNTAPRFYRSGVEADVDGAVSRNALALPRDATWWDLVERLFDAGEMAAAKLAQRQAVPVAEAVPA